MKTSSLNARARLGVSLVGLLLLAATPTNAGDVLYYGVQKGQLYQQPTPDAPELAPGNPFVFEAFAEGTHAGEIYGVDLTRPSSVPFAIQGDGYSFSRKEVFASLSAVNSSYRSGTYRFDFDSENDFFTVAYVSLTGDTYPAAPHVTNYTAAQAVNPAANFTVQWEAFSGATLDDTVELNVYDETDSVVYSNNGLDGTAQSDTIPANALAAGKTYRGELIFWKSVDFVLDDSGAFGLSFYYKSTQFSVVTSGSTDNNPPPTMSSPVLQQSSGQFLFHIDGVAGRLYRIESTADFASWTPVQTIPAPAGGAFDFTESLGSSPRFYRVALLPP